MGSEGPLGAIEGGEYSKQKTEYPSFLKCLCTIRNSRLWPSVSPNITHTLIALTELIEFHIFTNCLNEVWSFHKFLCVFLYWELRVNV